MIIRHTSLTLTPAESSDELQHDTATDKNLPSILQQVKNFASAVGQETLAVLQGAPSVTPEEAERRFAICRDCEYFLREEERCSKCGCFLKWKTAWRAQKCPVEKW